MVYSLAYTLRLVCLNVRLINFVCYYHYYNFQSNVNDVIKGRPSIKIKKLYIQENAVMEYIDSLTQR